MQLQSPLQQTTQGRPAPQHAQFPPSTLVLLLAAGSSMLTDDVPTAPAPGRDAVVNAIQQLNAAPPLELFGADIDVMADTDEEENGEEEKEDKKKDDEVNLHLQFDCVLLQVSASGLA